MGRALIGCVRTASDLKLVGATASPGSAFLARDAGELDGGGRLGVAVSADLPSALRDADVALDFSHASALGATLDACDRAGTALLVGTTGYARELAARFEAAARRIPLLVAANTSLGITVLAELVRIAARTLPGTFDIEILEAHHRLKADAPSGTALQLAAAAGEARGVAAPPPDAARAGRKGLRQRGDIGFAVLRGGDIVGEHTVLFAGEGEQLSLGHRVTDRAIFARGALQAAGWLARQRPGLYQMRDFAFKDQRLAI